jgi:hypothetical protein
MTRTVSGRETVASVTPESAGSPVVDSRSLARSFIGPSLVDSGQRGRPSGSRRADVALDAVVCHRELVPTRPAFADRGAEGAAVGSAYASAKPCRQLG